MAGRVQLATTGSQDVFFTEKPEYTHFIKNFRKHANFAVYDIKHELKGEVSYGSKLKCTIPADSGDLIKSVRLHINLSQLKRDNVYYKYTESIGHAIIEYVDLIIGGQLIQRIPRDWLQIYSEHYITQSKQTNLSKLIGKNPNEISGEAVSSAIDNYLDDAITPKTYVVDIPFYFHNNPELYIPLRAFKVHECELEIQLSEKKFCIYDYLNIINEGFDESTAIINSVDLYTEMVLLDSSEQKMIEKMQRDYIITQIQCNTFRIPASVEDGNDSMKFRLNFSNPVKELYFVISRVSKEDSIYSYFDYDHPAQIYPINGRYINYENLVSLEMVLDKEVILDNVTGNLINLRAVQSGIHHSRTQLFRRFYSYSFALEPEKWYPTGHINFSSIKDQLITLKLNNNTSDVRELRVYALSNNIFRIKDGSGQLIFPNGSIGN
jgi:hypothetical protein